MTKEERFKSVTAAFSILGDAENRAAYDRQANGVSLEDLFGDLFRHPPPPPEGATLGDLFADFLASFFRPAPASPTPPAAHAAWRTEPRRGVHLRCPLPVPFLLALRGGRHDFLHGTKTLSVQIPPGVESGTKLRLAGRGEAGSPPGDLFLEVQVEPHPHLRRAESGLNLLAELPLTWHELVAGGPLVVRTPWGPYPLRFAPLRLEEGHEIEVAGYGVRLPDRRGSLIYTVRLVQPPPDAAGLIDLRETLAYLQARQHPRANLEESML